MTKNYVKIFQAITLQSLQDGIQDFFNVKDNLEILTCNTCSIVVQNNVQYVTTLTYKIDDLKGENKDLLTEGNVNPGTSIL